MIAGAANCARRREKVRECSFTAGLFFCRGAAFPRAPSRLFARRNPRLRTAGRSFVTYTELRAVEEKTQPVASIAGDFQVDRARNELEDWYLLLAT